MMDWASLSGVDRMGLIMFFTGRPRGLVLAFLVILVPYDVDVTPIWYCKQVDMSTSLCFNLLPHR